MYVCMYNYFELTNQAVSCTVGDPGKQCSSFLKGWTRVALEKRWKVTEFCKNVYKTQIYFADTPPSPL